MGTGLLYHGGWNLIQQSGFNLDLVGHKYI